MMPIPETYGIQVACSLLWQIAIQKSEISFRGDVSGVARHPTLLLKTGRSPRFAELLLFSLSSNLPEYPLSPRLPPLTGAHSQGTKYT